MRKRLKIFLILGLIALLGAAALSGFAFYYYSNPSKLKHLAENALSGFTGAECSISEISYSKKPPTLRFKGIELIDHLRGAHLEIPEISAVISIQGGLGRRTLIFEDLRVNGFTMRAAGGWSLPRIAGGAQGGSLVRRMLGRLFSFFVFKDTELHEASLINGRITGQWGDATIHVDGLYANLTPERFLEAGCGVRIRSAPHELDLRLPRLKWVSSHPVYPPGETIQAELKGEDIALEAHQGKVSSATLDTTMVFHGREKTLALESFRIITDAATVHADKERPSLSFPCVVEAKAGMDFREAKLAVSSLRVALGDTADFKGEFHARFTGTQGFMLKVHDLRIVPENLLRMLPGPTKDSLEGVVPAGPVHISGRVEGNLDQGLGQWACDLDALFRKNEISFASPGITLRTALTGEVQLRGPLSGPEFHVNMGADESRARIGALDLEKGRFRLSVTGAYPAFRVNELRLGAAAAKWKMGGREFLVEEIEAQTRQGSLDVQAKSLDLPELSLNTSTLKNLSFSVEVSQEVFSVDAKGEDVHLVEFGRAMGFLPHGWKINSTESLQARVVLGKEGRLTSSAELRIQGLSFESEDGNFLGENLFVVLEPAFEGKVGPRGKLGGAVSLSAAKGELLYDRFYLDLNRHPVILAGNGSYDPASGALDVAGFRLRLEDLAALNIEGRWTRNRPENSRFLLHVPTAPLAPIFRQFIVEPYKRQNPSLTDLRLDGFFSLDLELSGKDALWTVKGRSRWHEGQAATGGKGILLKGIELDLPIWYDHATKGGPGKTPSPKEPVELEGGLFIRSAQLPYLPAQPVGALLKAGPDRLYTLSPIAIMTAGGQIDMGRILIREPFTGPPNIETSLTLKEIDLNPWLSAIWSRPVSGVARGKLDPVHWHGDTLAAEGKITAGLFDGQLVVSNVGAKRFPSLTPVITLDAAWSDLNLGQITGDTAFGKIQGVLRGHAKGLEIADGQPQAFELLMETVKKKDARQRISIQAVDNIARIGGGASPFSGLTGAFLSFFRELPYEKIGISAVLENDVFRINGTIRENGKEYLIKKGGFSGVDVIIGGPGSNTISFKDMVRRIKRVTGAQEGPVIE